MSDKLPAWVIDEIDSLRRNFLWAGKETAVRGKNLVAWPTVCCPTSCGGLGVANLRLSGFALRVRWLWMQRTEEQRAWSALPIKIEPEVQALFDASVVVHVGNGERTLFWLDNWINGSSVARMAPHLFQVIPKRIARRRTVADALPHRRWIRDIRGGLSVLVLRDYIQLWQTISDLQLSSDPDRFVWRWTASGTYSAASAYRIMHHGTIPLPGSRWVWKNWAPQRVKFFVWLALKQRLWTADRRRRHGLDAHDNCWFCDQELETTNHMLVNCSFAKEIWWTVLSWMECSCSFPEPMQLHQWWNHVRFMQVKERRRGLDTLVMLILWSLWKERNARLFDGHSSTILEVQERIKVDIKLWIDAGATRLGCLRRE